MLEKLLPYPFLRVQRYAFNVGKGPYAMIHLTSVLPVLKRLSNNLKHKLMNMNGFEAKHLINQIKKTNTAIFH
jgi:hypothetical protein